MQKINLDKRGQITIYIIIAIVIVATIIVVFVLMKKSENKSSDMENPESYLQSCVSDAVEQAVGNILPQGGYFSPQLYKLYNNTKVEYLCYTPNWYSSCTNQEPMYVEHIEKEIEEIIDDKINFCFESLEENFEDRGYNFEISEGNFKVNLVPNKIEIEIAREIILEKAGDTKTYKNFSIKFMSPVYELANIAVEILDSEAKNCEFDYLSYKNKYNKFDIQRVFTEDNTKIYTIGDEIKLNFAVRSCALPGSF